MMFKTNNRKHKIWRGINANRNKCDILVLAYPYMRISTKHMILRWFRCSHIRTALKGEGGNFYTLRIYIYQLTQCNALILKPYYAEICRIKQNNKLM